MGKIQNNTLNYTLEMIRFNFRIVFGGRFLWFIFAALVFFLFVASFTVYNGAIPDESLVYGLMLFPGVLLIFYPMTFGIQNDLDAGVLEILFGIPNYRYKVWLLRLLLVYVVVFFILILFGMLSSYLLVEVDVLEMSAQLMFPLMFVGNMAFMLSTQIKNGNGTAVVVVVIGVVLLFLASATSGTMWNVFLEPFDVPNGTSELLWSGIVLKNRIFLSIGAIVFLLLGLTNLQKREGFI